MVHHTSGAKPHIYPHLMPYSHGKSHPLWHTQCVFTSSTKTSSKYSNLVPNTNTCHFFQVKKKGGGEGGGFGVVVRGSKGKLAQVKRSKQLFEHLLTNAGTQLFCSSKICVLRVPAAIYFSSSPALFGHLTLSTVNRSSPTGVYCFLLVLLACSQFSHLLVFSLLSVFSNKNLLHVYILLLWSVNVILQVTMGGAHTHAPHRLSKLPT